jgi:hypothetical protein
MTRGEKRKKEKEREREREREIKRGAHQAVNAGF